MLQVIDWHYVTAHSKTPPRKPEPLERPGVQKPSYGVAVPLWKMREMLPGIEGQKDEEGVSGNGS